MKRGSGCCAIDISRTAVLTSFSDSISYITYLFSEWCSVLLYCSFFSWLIITLPGLKCQACVLFLDKNYRRAIWNNSSLYNTKTSTKNMSSETIPHQTIITSSTDTCIWWREASTFSVIFFVNAAKSLNRPKIWHMINIKRLLFTGFLPEKLFRRMAKETMGHAGVLIKRRSRKSKSLTGSLNTVKTLVDVERDVNKTLIK